MSTIPIQPGAMLYTQGFGSRPENVEVPHIDVRAPASTDTQYPIGKIWIYQGVATYTLLSQTSFGGVVTSNWGTSTTFSGVSAAMSGTPGAITVINPAVTANSIIVFARATTGGTPGQVSITAQSAGSFTLTSTGNETSTFNYIIQN